MSPLIRPASTPAFAIRSIDSALPRIPPVTSGAPAVGRRFATTSSVRSRTTVRRPWDGPERIPGTSLTKMTRAGRSGFTSCSAIVSALRMEAPQVSSGTTSPNDTGERPRWSASVNGAESKPTSCPSRLRACVAIGTDAGETPAATRARRTSRCSRRTSVATIAAPRARCAAVSDSSGARASPNFLAPGWPNDPAPWRMTTRRSFPLAISSANRARTFCRGRSTSRFRVITEPPNFTTMSGGSPEGEAVIRANSRSTRGRGRRGR